jgi:hypothetical protein
MFTISVLVIIVAVAAYAGYAWLAGRREARAYGQTMGVRFTGHVALNRRRISSGGGFGVTPEPHVARSWQHEDARPSALDLLYEQMDEQRQLRDRLRREEERERDY